MTWQKPRGVLAELVAAAADQSQARQRLRPALASESRKAGPGGRFVAALGDRSVSGFPVIAEVKRASPSAGSLKRDADGAGQAAAYVQGGARCLSVLTESQRFGGSLDDLRLVRAAVKVPLLRKDFMVDPYMVYEAAEAGADCILLIAAAVEPSALFEMADLASALGLDALVELIFERDLEVLEQRDFPLVGVNARDLETLAMDPGRFGAMAPRIRAPQRLLVAESGVQGPADVSRYAGQGASAVLVGEAAMRAADPAAFVRSLVEAR